MSTWSASRTCWCSRFMSWSFSIRCTGIPLRSLLKEWQDAGAGTRLGLRLGGHGPAGQDLVHAVSAGGLEAMPIAADGYNGHFTIPELLHPIEQSAVLCGMTYLPPFALFRFACAVEIGRSIDTSPLGTTALSAACLSASMSRARNTCRCINAALSILSEADLHHGWTCCFSGDLSWLPRSSRCRSPSGSVLGLCLATSSPALLSVPVIGLLPDPKSGDSALF